MIDLKKLRKGFIVAEISANHGQNLKTALLLIKKAKECGVDAVKFQAYTPESLTIKSSGKYFKIKHPKWGGQTLYDLYRKAATPLNWFKRLKKYANDLGLVFFATAYDRAGVDFLEELRVPIHKIASFELVDLALIEYMSATGKPVMISTGMATFSEIKDAVSEARRAGAKDIAILKCVSGYPADPEEINLKTITHIKKSFHCTVGLSDHTLGMGTSVAAVALGAEIIEKHFTLSRKMKTPDSFFSMEPDELKNLVENIRIAEKSLGKISYGVKPHEKTSRIFRRSLFAVQDIRQGDKFTEHNLRAIRPAYGASPKFFRYLIGKTCKKNIKMGTPITLDIV